MRRVVQRGLTLIEQMIVIALIGIVAAVAFPVWQDYTVRKKVREAVDLAHPARAALGVACSEGGLAGKDNESLGLSPAIAYAGEHTRSIAAVGRSPTEGTVTITFNAIGGAIEDGHRIVYTGDCGADGMRWTMTGDVPPKYRPAEESG